MQTADFFQRSQRSRNSGVVMPRLQLGSKSRETRHLVVRRGKNVAGRQQMQACSREPHAGLETRARAAVDGGEIRVGGGFFGTQSGWKRRRPVNVFSVDEGGAPSKTLYIYIYINTPSSLIKYNVYWTAPLTSPIRRTSPWSPR